MTASHNRFVVEEVVIYIEFCFSFFFLRCEENTVFLSTFQSEELASIAFVNFLGNPIPETLPQKLIIISHMSLVLKKPVLFTHPTILCDAQAFSEIQSIDDLLQV